MAYITVKALLEACKEQIEMGNGDKVVLFVNDEEGNGAHPSPYDFTVDIDEFLESVSMPVCYEEDHFSSKNAVLLG